MPKTLEPEAIEEQEKPAFNTKLWLEKNLPRQVGDRLKVVQITPNTFRANWYAQKIIEGNIHALKSWIIRQSYFVNVLQDDGQSCTYTYAVGN